MPFLFCNFYFARNCFTNYLIFEVRVLVQDVLVDIAKDQLLVVRL